ncbi:MULTISPECIES: cation:proton antiporter [Variovorax]|jgi:CPA1 family monovalent cation:H+ antiporter|uniref:cation:proton antiporter n=1 Tax=Variovorax TaxID=34072 RepID=UPI000897EAA5|nr:MULTISPECIES: sodium:proton antiporter [Variovorax]MDQ0081111.1 CPA1 family monovalent cation:H+ antiporter [Variovorax boronicumulans]SDZ44588.1 sodium/proton antiporter, CPA1 family [Variovorax sp. YR266]
MDIFENVLVMLIAACLLLQLSRRLALPYPSMLALAGVCLGAMPWVPHISLDPHLALALFIAPALLDSAFDISPRELRRNWMPLISLVLVAVLLTTAVVAWAGWAFAGLPLAAAITLGAIVAPPDAVAAAAVMQQFRIPRRTLSIINGESLLNDAVALLVFGVAVSAAGAAHVPMTSSLPMLLVAVPGGALVGFAFAKLNIHFGSPLFAGTRSAIIFQFVMTFGAWIVAERLHLSPIISVVAFGMTLGQFAPKHHAPRDRVHSYAVWGAVVFTLNVLAFFLMGLQARSILERLSGPQLVHALQFAGLVLVLVIAVRVVWVQIYGAAMRTYKLRLIAQGHDIPVPSRRIGLLVGWSGMRGLVTMATAFALPADFPGRDLIVLSAFAVVLGTLVIQGFTIGPLIRALKIEPDASLDKEVSLARTAMMDAALSALEAEESREADAVRDEYRAARVLAQDERQPQAKTAHDRLRAVAIRAQRQALEALRHSGQIEDDAYHQLEEEMDWAELNAIPANDVRLQSV